MKPSSSFIAITSEGGLLPADFLAELLASKTAIEGLTPLSYNLAEGERINEHVNRSWNRLQGRWADFKKATAGKQPGQSTTTETRDRWLHPIFQELGFGQKLPQVRAIEIDGRSYPVSHGWNHVPIHLVGSHVDLDRRTPGAVGAARASPHSLVQQVLNASEAHLWGILSNGFTFRLLRDNVALTRMSYVEWDLAAIFDGDLYSEFFVLWLVAHQSRFDAERPERCWLEQWKKAAEDTGLRALEKLRPGVERAIAALGAGLVSRRANAALREKLRAGQLSTQEFYRQVLRVVYRMLFLFVAEDRGLLHPPLPKDPVEAEAALRARRRYRDFYSISRLRRFTLNRAGTPHSDLWAIFQLISGHLGSHTGCSALDLPALGSFLWNTSRSTPDVPDCLVSNRHFLTAVHALTFIEDGNVRRAVDYRNLGSEEFGSVYESLLELHPIINADAGTFELQTAAGHERKTTGSYYTPDSLVQCLLDSALEPVMADAVRGKEGSAAAEALLALKICDPAVGSGHFLIAAAHRIARRVAAARSGEEEPSPEATRAALREVIGRCLYAVDVNPMAAELCRVSLWMEALDPGKPLSFLDHHIQCGNSLLGATPRALHDGLSDDAFKSLTGDDPDVCKEAKKRNKEERRQIQLFHGTETKPWEHLGSLPAAMLAVETMSDETSDALHAKEQRYADLVRSSGYLHTRFIADAWCAAFIWKKCKPADGGFDYVITNDVLRKIERNPHDCAPWMREEVERLRDQYQFFHWHLAFPEVFPVPQKGEPPANAHTGWNGGFDAMLGNPPWERVKLQEKEWFAERRPDIADAPSAATRKRLIEKLAIENPALYSAFVEDVRQADGESHVLRDSGLFPLCARGDVNLYAVFAEAMRQHLAPEGRMGAVLPSGIATDDTTKFFFQAVTESHSLVSLFDFENKGIFPGVDSRYKFCLFTAGGGLRPIAETTDFVFFAHSTDDIRDGSRRFQLSGEAIRAINPDTETCPVFRSSRDAELSTVIYRRVRVFGRAEQRTPASWAARIPQGLYHQTNDASLLREPTQLLAQGFNQTGDGTWERDGEHYHRMFEGRMVHLFNNRAASVGISETNTFRSGVTIDVSEDQLRASDFISTPRYFVPVEETESRIPDDYRHSWMLVFKDVTGATNERTMISAFIPRTGVVYSLRVVLLREANAADAASLAANLNTFCFDYFARCKTPGNHITDYIFRQLPVLPPATYAQPCAWANGAGETLRNWLLPRVLELTYTAWDLEPFARDCGWFGPPFIWDGARRFQLRCELDAAFLHLYGLSREDAAYILDTFPIVRRKDEDRHDGDYRTKRVILEIYDSLQDAMKADRSYQTPLNPPPGPPLDGSGGFANYLEIAANPPSHIHLPREHVYHSGERHLSDVSLGFPSTPFVVRLGITPGAARIRVTPAPTDEIKIGEKIILATPTLHLHGAAVPAVVGRLGIESRTDAATSERYLLVSVRGEDGIAQARLSEAEWKGLRTIGRAEDLA
jgi:hypothetical protein